MLLQVGRRPCRSPERRSALCKRQHCNPLDAPRLYEGGTRGEIEGDVEDGCFALRKYDKATATYREEIFRFDDTAGETGGHFGGDRGLVADFCHILSGGQPSISYTSIENSITGHLLVYTADESRKTGRPIKMEVTK